MNCKEPLFKLPNIKHIEEKIWSGGFCLLKGSFIVSSWQSSDPLFPWASVTILHIYSKYLTLAVFVHCLVGCPLPLTHCSIIFCKHLMTSKMQNYQDTADKSDHNWASPVWKLGWILYNGFWNAWNCNFAKLYLQHT